ncbi:hypothetical protein WN51_03132 [Melipona quadrifasciata]|uniref:Uncharacterized protein n=1 Tax=Melipona quadrifasciata TaxID=166423 RepID=A0A0N0BEK2_9HYME|nr:hypothetical protein WN51_03132 [Melipona quadrifasciata]
MYHNLEDSEDPHSLQLSLPDLVMVLVLLYMLPFVSLLYTVNRFHQAMLLCHCFVHAMIFET